MSCVPPRVTVVDRDVLLHIDINNLVAISHTGPLKLIEISFSLLPGSCAPHGITVVDGDVLALLDINSPYSCSLCGTSEVDTDLYSIT